MTAVKTFNPRTTPRIKKILSRHSHFLVEGPLVIVFIIYGSSGDKYTVTITKQSEFVQALNRHAKESELIQIGNLIHNSHCTCEFDREYRRNDDKVCWHIYRGIISYLDRIRRNQHIEAFFVESLSQ